MCCFRISHEFIKLQNNIFGIITYFYLLFTRNIRSIGVVNAKDNPLGRPEIPGRVLVA